MKRVGGLIWLSAIRDMGKIMGKLKERHAGQMDFGAVGPQVKARLG